MTKRLRISSRIGTRGAGNSAFDHSYAQNVKKDMDTLTKELLGIFDQFEDASPEIMLEALRPNFIRMRDELTPIATGALRASEYLEITNTGKNARVEIGAAFRGYPDYGAYVHEATWIPHQHGRSKFVQAAVMEDLDGIYQRVGEGYRVFMGSA